MVERNRGVRRLTLDEVDPPAWTWPPPASTYVVQRCHALRRVPVSALGVEDLRLLVGQRIALPVLLPIALERLEADPRAEGDLYAGDLLDAVLRVASEQIDDVADLADLRSRLAGVEVRAREIQARQDEPWWTPDDIGLVEPGP